MRIEEAPVIRSSGVIEDRELAREMAAHIEGARTGNLSPEMRRAERVYSELKGSESDSDLVRTAVSYINERGVRGILLEQAADGSARFLVLTPEGFQEYTSRSPLRAALSRELLDDSGVQSISPEVLLRYRADAEQIKTILRDKLTHEIEDSQSKQGS